ncbi:thioesterase domain-containing protein [Methylobacterium sp.]|uniref:thioesterase domain-containing protein n=1 Tax=Methylobacterium sp. TaxID=409 RepID=UPI003B00A9C9
MNVNSTTLFALTSIVGDDRNFKCFREQFLDLMTCLPVEFPDVYSNTDHLTDITVITNRAVERILMHQPNGPIFIMGYSFGGCVALEVARTLKRKGREIGFLMILDAPNPWMKFDLHRTTSFNSLHLRSIRRQIFIDLVTMPLLTRLIRATLLKIIGAFFPGKLTRYERVIAKMLRERARCHTWNPTPTELSGLLVYSTQFEVSTKEFWRTTCPRMVTLKIESGHVAMLHPDHTERLIDIARSCISTKILA